MQTLTSAAFMKILYECCKDGQINDEKFEALLSTYFPYNLVFKGGLRENGGW